VKRFPKLKVVVEHATTAEAVAFVERAAENVAATLTAHHLLMNRNAIFAGGINPHHYCLPVLKREPHRRALVKAATSGNPKFFLGTDSAPHSRAAKESCCGSAGMYTAHAALELYAEAFEAAGALDKLEGFASRFGADFYGLPRNSGTVTLERAEWSVPESYPLGAETVVPLRAGQKLRWRLVAPRRVCRPGVGRGPITSWNGPRRARLCARRFSRRCGPPSSACPPDRWPTHADLTRAAAGVVTSRGEPVRFVVPRDASDRERRYYELHIAQTGEVETRPENWHDLFNALAWIAYPRAKAAINAQHAAIFEERGEAEAKRRSPERDALTLFDEGGVAVVSDDPGALRLDRGLRVEGRSSGIAAPSWSGTCASSPSATRSSRKDSSRISAWWPRRSSFR
jgi:hypothetical protein